MAELKPWSALEPGGTVIAADAEQPHTGAWRTGVKPSADLSRCVDCLLCWLHCPDSAVLLDGTSFAGFDFDYCKGCEICEAVCPADAIAMVAEETRLPPLGVTSSRRLDGGSKAEVPAMPVPERNPGRKVAR